MPSNDGMMSTDNLLRAWDLAKEKSRCCFCRESDDVSCMVDGDVCAFAEPSNGLKCVAQYLREHWLVKVRALLGPDSSDDKEIHPQVRWADEGIMYEADPRHVEQILRGLGMGPFLSLSTSGV